MRMADYPFKMNEFCCHGALFLWRLQHFMNMVCLSNTVAMATLTRFLLKIIAKLIDKICYYASRMDELSLNYSEKLWFLTLFKCVLVNLLQDVVRSLLSAGGPIYPPNILFYIQPSRSIFSSILNNLNMEFYIRPYRSIVSSIFNNYIRPSMSFFSCVFNIRIQSSIFVPPGPISALYSTSEFRALYLALQV